MSDILNDNATESPFEFRALEVALEAICSFLAARTTELETSAYPALDELTSKVESQLLHIIYTSIITLVAQENTYMKLELLYGINLNR